MRNTAKLALLVLICRAAPEWALGKRPNIESQFTPKENHTMLSTNKKGFTLIELLIVVVIIGILAAIAIPKFAATKDKAKLASVKTDLRNIMTAEEAYFSDASAGYTSTLATTIFAPSAGNTFTVTGSASSYTATVTNASITVNPKSCTVTVGGSAATDGQISC